MGAPFPRWANTALRLTLLGVVGGLVGGSTLLIVWMRSPWTTNVGVPVAQPVPFDHRHHVNDDGIDCRYCHTTVETAAFAGVPPTAVCMGCHSQIWRDSPLLAPVRASYFSGEPTLWRRVNALPDFVYFNHSIHVTSGVSCDVCHGRVDQMAQVAKGAPLTMQWCLDCHRSPESHFHPTRKVRPGQHCSACHR